MYTFFKLGLLALACNLIADDVFGLQIARQHDTVQHLTTPYLQFYSKYLNSGGIPIRSAEVVSDSALILASGKLNLMLRNIPEVRKNLVTNGAELHIIGKDQQTSDLPEFAAKKGVKYLDNGVLTDIDTRTRGMGGLYASCGEENLLNLPGDRYAGGSDICVHEFAHTLMNYGLDSTLRNKIITQYHLSISQGLWKGAYAGSNEQEYWAELTMWYFGAHGAMVPGKQIAPGPKALQAYDPGGYALLDLIYSGKLRSAIIVKKSTSVPKGTPSGNSSQKSKLTVINNSAKKLKVSWVDQKGQEKFFAEVLPSVIYTCNTFYTHVWLIDNGDEPVYIQVFDPQCEIKINNP